MLLHRGSFLKIAYHLKSRRSRICTVRNTKSTGEKLLLESHSSRRLLPGPVPRMLYRYVLVFDTFFVRIDISVVIVLISTRLVSRRIFAVYILCVCIHKYFVYTSYIYIYTQGMILNVFQKHELHMHLSIRTRLGEWRFSWEIA